MAQPRPLMLAQHLHNAANEVTLFDNLPAVNDGHTLQDVVNGLASMRTQMEQMEMRINARFEVVETRINAKIEVL